MENTKENNQDNICGYCGSKIPENESGTLTITDKDEKILDNVKICNGCAKRLHLKFALARMSKEDVDLLDDFLSRSKTSK